MAVRVEPVAQVTTDIGELELPRWRAVEDVAHDASMDELAARIVAQRQSRVTVGSRRRVLARVLFLGDVTAIVLAVLASQAFAAPAGGAGGLSPARTVIAVAVALSAWVILNGLYGFREKQATRAVHSTVDELGSLALLCTAVAWIVFVAGWAAGTGPASGGELVTFWLLLLVLLVVGRSLGRSSVRRRAAFLQNTIIVGTGSSARRMARLVLRHRDYGLNLLGFVPATEGEAPSGLAAAIVCPSPEQLLVEVRPMGVERAIVAVPGAQQRHARALVKSLSQAGLTVDIAFEISDSLGPGTVVHSLEGLPLLSLPPASGLECSGRVKRAIDVVVSSVVMVLFAPVFLVTAVAVMVDSRGPVIYRHRRVGRQGRPIDILKFRTMRMECCVGPRYGGDAAERELRRLMDDPELAREFKDSHKFSNDPRVTRIGGFLRKTSLDELPQLVNVLKGDLSLVGPRPITAEEVLRYGPSAEELLSVRPGVTGYWQINGRSSLDYDERIRLDLAYVSGRSVRLDLEILAKTARVVLARGGAV